MSYPRRAVLAATSAVVALGLMACSGGGASDEVGAAAEGPSDDAKASSVINLYAYAVPKVGFDKVIPAFTATAAGEGVEFRQSYGASGDQSRKVEAGAEADFVNFSVEPDITRLVKAGLVADDWTSVPNGGVPFGSVVTIIVREGNPKDIQDWDDLLAAGVEVVTPNPFSSGSAKWNLLAPYSAKSEGGANPDAGLAYISELVGDHIKVQPKSAREATETFLQGTGDVLLSYENEALFIEEQGEAVEHVTPAITFRIDNPVAVLKDSPNLEVATAFRDYLFTPEAQRLWAEAGFRPVDATVAGEFTEKFPAPEKLWTIDDLGGWGVVDSELFDKENGSIAVIYDGATS
ncbi:sulfate ABC transporter substrate-binding protein [Tessaracoccus caeni]|uniref:sulfate ABC transporter substrate-binding protein n=1 Tax=Tessaracoccus caeni TaxID=3031239 RepID=UPI0023DB4243|nr:sulfate ABC transporter substrate-binding protein [Tessaracoccus caeni]MDF1487230.1 sulfate ABC transporter substrate-binding protein [Tessaracoccus caeni]